MTQQQFRLTPFRRATPRSPPLQINVKKQRVTRPSVCVIVQKNVHVVAFFVFLTEKLLWCGENIVFELIACELLSLAGQTPCSTE